MINIPKDLSDIEVGLYKSGYEYCEKLVKEENIAIAEAVENTADRFSGLKMIADIECLKKFLFSEVTAYTEPSIGVRDPNLEDKTWWDELKKKPKFKSEYWSRYYDYLLKKPSWSITAVKNIDSSTDEIMNALTNPRKGTAGERMGMVFGYVQSGKTAHYIGMINKAYDAGYRIVIVLSGIHNSLRSQTQSRIDEEVLGYETSLEYIGDMTRERNVIGVGIGSHNQVETVVQSITGQRFQADPYVCGLIAMSLNSGAYQVELIRSGILGVDKGQWEACETIGLNYVQTMRYVILPQAFKRIIPPLISEFITLIKDSSLIFTIGAVELLATASVIGANTFNYLVPLTATGAIYLVMTLCISAIARYVEGRLAVSD